MASLTFKEKFTLEQRITKAQKLKQKYSDLVHVIVEKYQGKNASSRPHTPLKCNIFSLAKNWTAHGFNNLLFNKLQIGIDSHTGLHLYVNQIMLTNQSFEDIQKQYQDEDGFVYIQYEIFSGFG